MKTKLLTTLTLILSLNCPLFPQSSDDRPEELQSEQISDKVLSTLMFTCYVCHNPRIKAETDAIAPPLVEVKYMYKSRYPDKNVFVEKVTNFVMGPNNQKAILQGPVMQFGVMPEMPLDENQVRSIAGYIFDNKIEEPVWFSVYFSNKHGMKWEGQ